MTSPPRTAQSATAQSAMASAVLLAPGQDQPLLDSHVQSFLDRQAEAPSFAEEPSPAPTARARQHFRPSNLRSGGAAMLYLHVPDSEGQAPDEAVQLIADRACALLVLQSLPLHSGIEELEPVIVAALEELKSATALLLGGHGIGALIATCFASRPASAPFSLELLVLATPLLAWPDASGSTPWLPTDAARGRAALARKMLDEAGWPGGYNEDRLHRLPPVLILTAEVDPFRRGAEHFARRLLAAEGDVSALRTIGSIHDFVWLPDLLDARCTKPAHALIVDALCPQPRDAVAEVG
ncbi:alpha/beta hydrolase [Novosphingobium sp. ZW T3_23]|uniref:alpha/beta hydrolase n=1 Tax=Novosphingobium sp. ZW T3_23 TaxID=3378084 RepID=UPI003852A81F